MNRNGSILGKANTPAITVAKGTWDLHSLLLAEKGLNWPWAGLTTVSSINYPFSEEFGGSANYSNYPSYGGSMQFYIIATNTNTPEYDNNIEFNIMPSTHLSLVTISDGEIIYSYTSSVREPVTYTMNNYGNGRGILGTDDKIRIRNHNYGFTPTYIMYGEMESNAYVLNIALDDYEYRDIVISYTALALS